MAIIIALKKWRQYLLGGPKFEIWTDHKNLLAFQKPQHINRRQARWIQILQEYNFTLHYLEGKKNIRANALSRKDAEDDKEGDNQDVVMLPQEWFRRMVEDRKE